MTPNPISPERWQRAYLLFSAALERDEAERAQFIASSLEDDEVRKEVLRLLSDRESMEAGFLDPPGRQTLLDRAARALAARGGAGYEGQLLAGRYLVEKEIGRGGSAVVYLALDRHLHSRPVVIKFLHAALEDHERVRTKFLQEIEALSRLKHPAVVGVLDVGQAPDGRSFLVMEHVEGVTLRKRLQEGPLPLSNALAIAGAICDALGAAHGAGIFHRDIKPENIILTPAGGSRPVANLIDFGIAKVQDSGYDAQTKTLTVVGTVRYMAPEQLMGNPNALYAPSDIYSVGVVCYEMLTGRRPFESETQCQLYEMQKTGKVSPPSELQKGIPLPVDEAILRALSFRPEERQGSALAFAAELQRRPKWRWPGAGRRIWPVMLAALLLLIAAFGWYWSDRGWGSYKRVLEFAGGRNPEEFGFRSQFDLVERPVPNQERTGYDAVRLITNDQGYYYSKLTHAQTYAAMRNGWRLSATMKTAEGLGAAGVDLTPAGPRYAVTVLRNESHRQVVQLTTAIAAGLDGASYELPAPDDAWHDYELVFDPATQTAHLQVDGVERLRGYSGLHEYMEGWGLMFSTVIYRSTRGETLYKRVRFEIGPWPRKGEPAGTP